MKDVVQHKRKIWEVFCSAAQMVLKMCLLAQIAATCTIKISPSSFRLFILHSTADAAIVYDSSHTLNMNRHRTNRYDCSIEKAVCVLISPMSSSIIMDVADVEQQKVEMTVVSAIAHAALFSERKDPTMLSFQQCVTRSSLVQSFAGKDISIFLGQSTKLTQITAQSEVQTCICRIYCHCKMPCDGKLMVKCTACDAWLHGVCESQKITITSLILSGPAHHASSRQSSQKKEERWWDRKYNFSKNSLTWRQQIKKQTWSFPFTMSWLSLFRSFGFRRVLGTLDVLPKINWKAASLMWKKKFRGLTYHEMIQDGFHFFIVITKRCIAQALLLRFSTIVHEITYARHLSCGTGGQDHGVQFKREGKYFIEKIRKMQGKLSSEYQKLDIDSNTIPKAKF